MCTCGFDLAFFSCVTFQEYVIYNEKSLKFIGTCLTVWYVINVYKYSVGALKMYFLQFLGKIFNIFPLGMLLILFLDLLYHYCYVYMIGQISWTMYSNHPLSWWIIIFLFQFCCYFFFYSTCLNFIVLDLIKFRIVSPSWTDCYLSLVSFKFILSVYNIATPALFWLTFVWSIFF